MKKKRDTTLSREENYDYNYIDSAKNINTGEKNRSIDEFYTEFRMYGDA